MVGYKEPYDGYCLSCSNFEECTTSLVLNETND